MSSTQAAVRPRDEGLRSVADGVNGEERDTTAVTAIAKTMTLSVDLRRKTAGAG